MALNFTNNLEEYTTTQRNTRVKHFAEFTSKKQLEEANTLSDERLEFVKSIKGTFSFALHEDGRYMAVTLYKSNGDRRYSFLVLDLQDKVIAEVDSIKNAKAEILELAEKEMSKAIDDILNSEAEEQEEKKTSKKKADTEEADAEETNAEEADAEEEAPEETAEEA